MESELEQNTLAVASQLAPRPRGSLAAETAHDTLGTDRSRVAIEPRRNEHSALMSAWRQLLTQPVTHKPTHRRSTLE